MHAGSAAGLSEHVRRLATAQTRERTLALRQSSRYCQGCEACRQRNFGAFRLRAAEVYKPRHLLHCSQTRREAADVAQSHVAGDTAPSSGHDGMPATSNSGPCVIGSIGVVYGDIGTSPLYAFREAVHAAKATALPAARPCSASCR